MKKKLSVLLAFVFLVQVGSLALFSATRSNAQSLPVEVSLGFFTWWWSYEARQKFRRDYRPPYDTYIELKEWSFTDPIGGPDPYAFDIVVHITNSSETSLSDLEVTVSYQWKIGPIGSVESAQWSTAHPLRHHTIKRLPPRGSRELKVERFDIRKNIESLPIRSWTWALKVVCKVSKAERVENADDYQRSELVVERILPLIPGD